MKNFKNIILAGALAFTTPSSLIPENGLRTKKIVDVSGKINDALNMELIVILNDIYNKKAAEIDNFLINYSQITGEYLSQMPVIDFQKLINDVYGESGEIANLKVNKRFKNTDIDYILNKNKKYLEEVFDELFGIMLSQGEAKRVLLYIGYLKDVYGYSIDGFVEKYFFLENIPKGTIKENLEILSKELDSKKNKAKYIDNLGPNDIYGTEYFMSDNETKVILDIYMMIIKTKLKQLFIN